MSVDFDVIIVGSGPAGVSAAFPLVQAGKRVLMIDAGKGPDIEPPQDDYLTLRQYDSTQWRWMIGKDFHALKMQDAVSPKLRVPTHAFAFEGFSAANHIDAKDFISVGSLAAGGLSNSWGCGVARFGDRHLAKFPCAISEMDYSYGAVAQRIGVSGSEQSDDLSDYFGLDQWSNGAIELDTIHKSMYSRYQKRKRAVQTAGVRVGRARVAVLNADKGERKACNLSGNCLWGCSRQSLYCATVDLALLKCQPGFEYRSGLVVEKLVEKPGIGWELNCSSGVDSLQFMADTVLLAAGTLATTRLALNAISYRGKRPLLSCPTAAFLAWVPSLLGRPIEAGFGLGQLSYSVDITEGIEGFGSTFSPTGIAVSEFIRHLPFGARNSVRFMRGLLTSCVVGNLFLPGQLTNAQVEVDECGQLKVAGVHGGDVDSFMKAGHRALARAFLRMGAIILPGSFTVGAPGSDIHYAGTLPMVKDPGPGEVGEYGELFGASGLYIVDGACLPVLSEQSHTLTIMANADRIARHLVR